MSFQALVWESEQKEKKYEYAKKHENTDRDPWRGYSIAMDQSRGQGDVQDAEFERY